MITLISIVLVFLTLFVNPMFATIILGGVLIYNIARLMLGFIERKIDPVEWWIRLVINGGIVTIIIIFIIKTILS